MEEACGCSRCKNPVDKEDPKCESCRQLRPPEGWPVDFRLGQVVLERLVLTRRLGFGATGGVYLAEDADAGDRVAVKLLHRDLTQDLEIVHRFRLEAVLTKSLEIPQVVPAYDFGELPDGTHYFTMEYVEGVGLDQMLGQRNTLPLPTVLCIARQVLTALDVAHSRGVVHRDLKPGNLLLSRDPVGKPLVRILDFGFARMTDAGAGPGQGRRLTLGHTVLGTPTYMAPEQARGSRNLDGRADLYSLGIILYRALSGRAPFRGTMEEVLRAHLSTPPEPMSPRIPDVPPAMDAIVLKMLQKDPALRYAKASEVVAELDRAFPSGPSAWDLEDMHATTPQRAELERLVDRYVLGTQSLPALHGVSLSVEPSARKKSAWVWILLAVSALIAAAVVGIIFLGA